MINPLKLLKFDLVIKVVRRDSSQYFQLEQQYERNSTQLTLFNTDYHCIMSTLILNGKSATWPVTAG